MQKEWRPPKDSLAFVRIHIEGGARCIVYAIRTRVVSTARRGSFMRIPGQPMAAPPQLLTCQHRPRPPPISPGRQLPRRLRPAFLPWRWPLAAAAAPAAAVGLVPAAAAFPRSPRCASRRPTPRRRGSSRRLRYPSRPAPSQSCAAKATSLGSIARYNLPTIRTPANSSPPAAMIRSPRPASTTGPSPAIT